MSQNPLEGILETFKDSKDERLDLVLKKLLDSDKIHELTQVKPREMHFYFQMKVFAEANRFFFKNGKGNPKGLIKWQNPDMTENMNRYLLGLSRSREGWFVEEMFKFMRREDIRMDDDELKKRGLK